MTTTAMRKLKKGNVVKCIALPRDYNDYNLKIGDDLIVEWLHDTRVMFRIIKNKKNFLIETTFENMARWKFFELKAYPLSIMFTNFLKENV